MLFNTFLWFFMEFKIVHSFLTVLGINLLLSNYLVSVYHASNFQKNMIHLSLSSVRTRFSSCPATYPHTYDHSHNNICRFPVFFPYIWSLNTCPHLYSEWFRLNCHLQTISLLFFHQKHGNMFHNLSEYHLCRILWNYHHSYMWVCITHIWYCPSKNP